MPELSTAAQAVLDAAFYPWISTDTPASIAAAALRAAAAKLRDAYANEEYVDPVDDWLEGIAAELEGK